MGSLTKGLLAQIPKQAKENISASGKKDGGNPSETFLCFVTFYVLKTATKITLSFIFAMFPTDLAPGKLLLCLLLWSRSLAPST